MALQLHSKETQLEHGRGEHQLCCSWTISRCLRPGSLEETLRWRCDAEVTGVYRREGSRGLGRGRVWAVLPWQQQPQLIYSGGVLGAEMIQLQMRGWMRPGSQAFVPSISHSLGTDCNLGPAVDSYLASPSWQMLVLSLHASKYICNTCSLCLEWSFPSYPTNSSLSSRFVNHFL